MLTALSLIVALAFLTAQGVFMWRLDRREGHSRCHFKASTLSMTLFVSSLIVLHELLHAPDWITGNLFWPFLFNFLTFTNSPFPGKKNESWFDKYTLYEVLFLGGVVAVVILVMRPEMGG